jgi:ABC-type spermidine/putrescine transport system permease subunit II
MLKGALVPTIIVGIICVVVFSALEGLHGFYGALVAQVVVVIFFLVHLLISKLSRNLDPMATMALAMIS